MNRKQVDYEEFRRAPEAINISEENKKMENGVKYKRNYSPPWAPYQPNYKAHFTQATQPFSKIT